MLRTVFFSLTQAYTIYITCLQFPRFLVVRTDGRTERVDGRTDGGAAGGRRLMDGNGRMKTDGRMDGDGRTNERTDGRTDGTTDGRADVRTGTGGRMHGRCSVKAICKYFPSTVLSLSRSNADLVKCAEISDATRLEAYGIKLLMKCLLNTERQIS